MLGLLGPVGRAVVVVGDAGCVHHGVTSGFAGGTDLVPGVLEFICVVVRTECGFAKIRLDKKEHET